jgi:hypothetical protein
MLIASVIDITSVEGTPDPEVEEEEAKAAQDHLAIVLQHPAVPSQQHPHRLQPQALVVPLQLVLAIQALSQLAVAAVAVAVAVAVAQVLLCWPQTSSLLATVQEVQMQKQANRTLLRTCASAPNWNFADPQQ